jgi:hypothetical protein
MAVCMGVLVVGVAALLLIGWLWAVDFLFALAIVTSVFGVRRLLEIEQHRSAATSAECTSDGASEHERPEQGTEDHRRYAVLFNDITHAPVEQFVHFGTRHILADYLWAQGWRRDVRPEDVTGASRPTMDGTAFVPDSELS